MTSDSDCWTGPNPKHLMAGILVKNKKGLVLSASHETSLYLDVFIDSRRHWSQILLRLVKLSSFFELLGFKTVMSPEVLVLTEQQDFHLLYFLYYSLDFVRTIRIRSGTHLTPSLLLSRSSSFTM